MWERLDSCNDSIFYEKKQLLFWHGHFLEKDWLENIGKVFHLRSALILDYKFDSHCQASRQFCQVDWSIGLWVDTFYRHYFIPRVMPCFRMGAVAREKFAFLMGKEIFFLCLINWIFTFVGMKYFYMNYVFFFRNISMASSVTFGNNNRHEEQRKFVSFNIDNVNGL